MKDYDKEQRDAVQHFRDTPPGNLSSAAEGKAWIAVIKALDNVKGKPTAMGVLENLQERFLHHVDAVKSGWGGGRVPSESRAGGLLRGYEVGLREVRTQLGALRGGRTTAPTGSGEEKSE